MTAGNFTKAVLIFCLLLPLSAIGDPEDHDKLKLKPAPPASERSQTDRSPTLPELAAILREGAFSAAWFAAASKAIDLIGSEKKDELIAFNKTIANESAAKMFDAAIAARGIDLETLRGQARSSQLPDERKVAQHELARRLQDPHAKLIADYFYKRPENAVIEAKKLLDAVGDQSPAGINAAAALIDRMMGQLNRVQRTKLRDELKKIDDETRADSKKDSKYNRDFVRLLLEASMVSLGEPTGKNPFMNAFKALYDKTLERNLDFHRLVDAALKGDTAAKAKLTNDYDAEEVADFIGGQLDSKNDGVAVATAKAFATTTDKGSVLNLRNSNSSFENPEGSASLRLGSTDEQIRAALSALHNSRIGNHQAGVEGNLDPGVRSGLQLFALGGDRKDDATGLYAEKSGTTGSVLKPLSKGTEPIGALATEVIQVPFVAPRPLVEAHPKEPIVPAEPLVNPKLELTKANLEGLVKNCTGCHNSSPTGKPLLQVSGESPGNPLVNNLTLTQIIAKIDEVPKMKAAVALMPGVRAQLEAWKLAQ